MAPDAVRANEHDVDTTNPTSRSKRANNACARCRERKVKCSGTLPCSNCQRKSDQCVYQTDDKKVMVSERFLNDLKRKSGYGIDPTASTSKRIRRNPQILPSDYDLQNARAPEVEVVSVDADSPSSIPHPPGIENESSVVGDDQETQADEELGAMLNPLANEHANFLIDTMGRRRWLGPSSTWAFSQQVLSILQDYLGQHLSPEVPLNVDANAFKLNWPSTRTSPPQLSTDIPSLDHAIYLMNTVKFHLGQIYHLFDEEIFMTKLVTFYDGDPTIEPASESRLWYMQFLLIMAFGKALLIPGNSEQSLPGSGLVSRALELLPDVHGLFHDPISSIETLCCLALYLQSIDHRNSAYTYIGQAFRIALTQGLHREPLHARVDDKEANRRRYAWWTLYILDRKLSSLMGAPNSIQDSDLTVQLPTSDTAAQKYKAFGIHVALSKLHAKILNTVYSVNGKLDPSFLKNVQEVLTDAAKLAPHFTGFEIKFNTSAPVSRVSATLNLCYHQCIILATRPLLICVLQDVLSSRGNGTQGLVTPIKALLKTASHSASKSLRILSALQSQHLLECFLPFDLEQAFSAAFVLILTTAVPGVPEPNSKDPQTSLNVLDTMIERGNVVARYRKEELNRLQEMIQVFQAQRDLRPRPENHENGTTTIPDEDQMPMPYGNVGYELHADGASAYGHATVSTVNGLASEQIMSLAGLLDWVPEATEFDNDELAANWLWTESIPTEYDLRGGVP